MPEWQSQNIRTSRINHGDQEDISQEDLNKLLPRMHHQTQRQKNLILLYLPIHPEPINQILPHQEDQAGIGGVSPSKRIIDIIVLLKKQPGLNRLLFFPKSLV